MKEFELKEGGRFNKINNAGAKGEVNLFKDLVNAEYKIAEETPELEELVEEYKKMLVVQIPSVKILSIHRKEDKTLLAKTSKGEFIFVDNLKDVEIFRYKDATYADLGAWKVINEDGDYVLRKENINLRIYKSKESSPERKFSKTLFSGDESAVKWLGITETLSKTAVEIARKTLNIKSTVDGKEFNFDTIATLCQTFPIDYASDINYSVLCNFKEYIGELIEIKNKKVTDKKREVKLNLPYCYKVGEKETEGKRVLPVSLQLGLRDGDVRTGLIVITDVPIGDTNMLGGPLHSRYYERRVGMESGYSPKLFFGYDKTKGQSCVSVINLAEEMPAELQNNFFCGVDAVLSVHEIEKDSHTAEVKSNLFGLIELSKKIAKENKMSEYSWKVEVNVNGRNYTGLMLMTVIINDHLHGSYVNKITKDSDFYYASTLEKLMYGRNSYEKADLDKRALTFLNSNFSIVRFKSVTKSWEGLSKTITDLKR